MGPALAILLGCGGDTAPPPPPRPVLAVVVPLSGANADLGDAAVKAAQLAVGDALEVVPFDDTRPDAVQGVAADTRVVAAVAHVVRATAERQARAWLGVDVPVVVAAPGEFDGVPRVVPPLTDGARCAASLIQPADFWVRTDGSNAAGAAGQVLWDAIPEHYLGMETVDAGNAGRAAASLTGRRARQVVWVGDAAEGGNFLRALRSVQMEAPFVALGGYDPRFLASAGASAEGALVSYDGRPALDRSLVDAWAARFGGEPPVGAVGAYDAAALLLAAWQSAGAAGGRDGLRVALQTVVATGASGTMYLDAAGVVRPIVCATFRVQGGTFVLEKLGSDADVMDEEEEVKEKARRRQPGRKTLRPPPMPAR